MAINERWQLMARLCGHLLACFGAASLVHADQFATWKPVVGQLLTRWAGDVRPDNAWPEYPRPQMFRPEWLNLNGLWDYTITSSEQSDEPATYDGEILVPFCVESALSGVKKPVQPDQSLWYRRTFEVPPAWDGKRILLHFGAVDWSARVWLNGKHIGDHRGGYDPFTFDITDALASDAAQNLVVRVNDPTDQRWQPRGKQVNNPHGIWYTPTTGIWQTVWLEPVPELSIGGVSSVPDIDRGCVRVTVGCRGTTPGYVVDVEVWDKEKSVATATGRFGKEIVLPIDNPRTWSPDSPFLYDLHVSIEKDGRQADEVRSYFGMRKISIGKDQRGVVRLLLNNEPLFQFGVLDQGFWPDGLYTAPTDEALRSDLEVLKKLGFNMTRKHVKVEPDRWYYWCDKLGLLVWQDMPSGDRYIGPDDPDIERSAESAQQFQEELIRLIQKCWHHPSVVMWVIFNEGWGQFQTKELTEWVRLYDPTRLVDSASGWTDRGIGDVIDVHSYPGPAMRPPEPKRASVLGEFGGLGWPVEGHLWWDKKNWGYRTYTSRDELQRNYISVVRRLLPLIGQGLSAAVYTQTSDVEGEVNGLMTYDREILKLDVEAVARLHRRLYLSPPEVREIVPTSLDQPQVWRFTFNPPGEGWSQPGFDDSSWKTGKGMFGRQGTPGVTVGTSWTTSDIWLRREFRLDGIPQGDLQLHVYHDEDAEVYINGVLAGTFTQWVTSHVLSDMSEEARRALRRGTNVLAVHCHQTGGGQGIDVGISLVVEHTE
jgi:hypothetical protein